MHVFTLHVSVVNIFSHNATYLRWTQTNNVYL